MSLKNALQWGVLPIFFTLLFLLSSQTLAQETKSAILLHGYVEADYSYIAAPSSGWIERLNVQEGDEIHTDETLFVLDSELQQQQVSSAQAKLTQAKAQSADLKTGARPQEIAVLKAQLKQAKAQLKLAVAEMKRWQILVNQGKAAKNVGDQYREHWQVAKEQVNSIQSNIAVAELAARPEAQNAAMANISAAESAVEQAKWQLDQRTVNSRIQGRVEQVFHYQGEFVTAGSPVIAVLPPNRLKVKFFIPESQLSNLKLGETVQIKRDGASETLAAKISFISSSASYTPPVIFSNEARQKLVFLVEARLSRATLRPGQPVDVILP